MRRSGGEHNNGDEEMQCSEDNAKEEIEALMERATRIQKEVQDNDAIVKANGDASSSSENRVTFRDEKIESLVQIQ